MSDDRQENSIERQREQVTAYAARQGYEIVRWYTDEGIPGDEERKRKAFMAMLKDAQRREFDIILCDDRDRFGRFDSLTMGYYCKPLRDAGIRLETVAQGKIDWSSFAGRVTDAVLQEAKKLESQATSRRVFTRLLQMRQEGKWTGGRAPYGLKCVADALLGKRLAPGELREVRAVRLMFTWYDKGKSLNEIVEELYQRAIPNPHGGLRWGKTTIMKILARRAYVGDVVWNRQHAGKYTFYRDGKVSTSDSRTPQRRNGEADWVVLPGSHEGIIDRDLFLRVQERLERQRTHRPSDSTPRTMFGGLVLCGNCGSPMYTKLLRGVRYFQCSRYHEYGKAACHSNMLKQAGMLDCLVRKLQETFLNPDNLAKLRAEVRRQLKEQGAGNPAALDGYRKKIAELEEKERKGNQRLAILDADLVPGVAVEVRAWRQERQQLVEQLRRLETEAEVNDLEAGIRAAEEQLHRLREVIEGAEPLAVRAVLGELVSKIELYFTRVPKAKRTLNVFEKGVIYLRAQEGITLPETDANGDTPVGRWSGSTKYREGCRPLRQNRSV
jgi:DNA invertase Pin-like site-specific DNA recombinase